MKQVDQLNVIITLQVHVRRENCTKFKHKYALRQKVRVIFDWPSYALLISANLLTNQLVTFRMCCGRNSEHFRFAKQWYAPLAVGQGGLECWKTPGSVGLRAGTGARVLARRIRLGGHW